MKGRQPSGWLVDLSLIAVAMIWGATFVLVKQALTGKPAARLRNGAANCSPARDKGTKRASRLFTIQWGMGTNTRSEN